MNQLELHVLHSFPVSCLNRDEFDAPKSAFFGGVKRARISSQCMKYATRKLAKGTIPDFFGGLRTRLFVEPLAEAVTKHGVSPETAMDLAKEATKALTSSNKEKEKKTGKVMATALMFISPREIDALGQFLADIANAQDAPKITSRAIAKAVKSAQLEDGADIAIFGRMAASCPSLSLEGAAMFNHALSVHSVVPDIDFFAAVDDLLPEEETGAGMTGSNEFNSACYYKYVGLNLDLLGEHLVALPPEDFKDIIDAFIRACLISVPVARRNSMNACTLPSFVRGVLGRGCPLQLINAFEKPVTVQPGKSMSESAQQIMCEHHEQLQTTWGYRGRTIDIPEHTLDEFIEEVRAYVG